MGDDRNGKAVRLHRRHRQANTIDGDGALLHDVPQQGRGCLNGVPDGVVVLPQGRDGAGAVNVSGDDVTAEPAVRRHGPLQIHPTPRHQSAQGGAVQRLVHDVSGETAAVLADGGQAHAVHRYAVADFQIGQHQFRADGQHRRVGAPPDEADGAHLLNDSREHPYLPRLPVKSPLRFG